MMYSMDPAGWHLKWGDMVVDILSLAASCVSLLRQQVEH